MKAQLATWARLIGRKPKDITEESDLLGFFGAFRPHGAGVEAIFDGVALGPQLLERIRPIYAATAADWDAYPGARPAYFVPRGGSCTPARALELARAHLAAMVPILEARDEPDLVAMVKKVKLEVQRGGNDDDESDDGDNPAGWVYEQVGDYVGEIEPTDSAATFLDEAYYSIANDQYIKFYLMWPLYAEASGLIDPFAPYFELWRSGADLQWTEEKCCIVRLV